jgi:MoxR-like ATPase
LEEKLERISEELAMLRVELGKAIVGHEEAIEGVIICLLCGGHALLEGVPGLGKTLLVKSLGKALNLKFSRVQFTPDLMPADLIGTNMVMHDEDNRRYFQFQKGPIFTGVLLADEINRATPKTQSALLEAMQEQKVTVAGVEYHLGDPFMVLATQNPIEMEGTYPLPEAQLDRFFFKLQVRYPDRDELLEIVDRTTSRHTTDLAAVLNDEFIRRLKTMVREVPVAHHVKDYALRIVLATHPDAEKAPDAVRRYVRYGSSPRGLQSVIMASKARALMEGRYNASLKDVRRVTPPSLNHRLILNFEGEAEGVETSSLVDQILEQVPETEDKG